MNQNWSIAYTTTLEYQALMIKDLLEDHDIEVVIMNKKDSAYVLLGEIEIYVSSEDLTNAKYLIKNLTENEKPN